MPALATPSIPADLNAIVQRIHEKMANYERYNFSADHNDFLKAFFDLSQEYDQMEDFYRICVAVPLTVAAIPCDLYLCRKPDGVLELVCSCDCGLLPRPEPAVWPVYLCRNVLHYQETLFYPLCQYSERSIEDVRTMGRCAVSAHLCMVLI